MNTVLIGLHTRNLGTKTHQATNPFTGEQLVVHIDDGMSEAESHASSLVLAEAGASEPEPEGYRKVILRDGIVLHVNLGKKGGEIELDGGITADAVEFIFRLGLASGMLIDSTSNPDFVAVLPGQQHPGIAARWPAAVCLQSAAELMEWISDGIENRQL
jgi:hypothetical protein